MSLSKATVIRVWLSFNTNKLLNYNSLVFWSIVDNLLSFSPRLTITIFPPHHHYHSVSKCLKSHKLGPPARPGGIQSQGSILSASAIPFSSVVIKRKWGGGEVRCMVDHQSRGKQVAMQDSSSTVRPSACTACRAPPLSFKPKQRKRLTQTKKRIPPPRCVNRKGAILLVGPTTYSIHLRI